MANSKYGDLYTIIGLPLSEGETAVTDFIEGLGVSGVAHVLGSDALWADYRVPGTPAWMTIPIDGEAEIGFGAFGPSIVNGEDWI
ncbi:MAG: hypothetical protein V3V01_08920 [Acidimicrobiales bacterium]